MMDCPPRIAAILLEILTRSLLSVRNSGFHGEAEQCYVLADHVHNLPALIGRYSPDLLVFYWVTERNLFRDQAPHAAQHFEDLRRELEAFVEPHKQVPDRSESPRV